MLLGSRKNDQRPAEHIFQIISPLINLLLQGRQKKYRAVPANLVAACIQAELFNETNPTNIEIKRIDKVKL